MGLLNELKKYIKDPLQDAFHADLETSLINCVASPNARSDHHLSKSITSSYLGTPHEASANKPSCF